MVFAEDMKIQKPNYKEIKKSIQDKDSKFYYPLLMERYIRMDTTLTLEEYKHLYYGYFFNDSYSVYGVSNYVDSVNVILKKDSLLTDDYQQIIRYEKQVLEKYPFNLRDLNYLSNCYYRLGDTLMTRLQDYKLFMLARTITSTGDGMSEETAWHVLSVSHEYSLLEYMGFHFGGSQKLTTGGCDYLSVQENDYQIDGFYFDVNKILEKEGELLK